MPDHPEAYLARHVRQVCTIPSITSPLKERAESTLDPFPFYVKDEDAAVVIIDLSGYSKLTTILSERLGNTGAGADKLRNIINPYFARLVETCLSFGGDIFKFAGDSMVVAWTADTCNPIDLPTTPSASAFDSNRSLFDNIPRRYSSPSSRALACSLRILQLFKGHAVLAPVNPTTTTITVPTSPGSPVHPWAITPINRNINTSDDSDITALMSGRLSIHIGLGVGSVFRIHVGNQGIRRECFLSGTALGDASVCLDVATKGEMCMTAAAWKAILKTEPGMLEASKHSKLRSSYDGTSLIFDAEAAASILSHWTEYPLPLVLSGVGSLKTRKRLPGFTPGEGMELGPWFREYINEATAHRLLASRGEAQPNLNTLRKLSVVFLKLKEFPTGDAEEGLRIAQAVMDIVLPPLRQFQGTMRQFNVDDKGATVLLVWGLPPYSHEIESVHALQAAVSIRDACAPVFGRGFSIGVTTGSVFTGSIGNDIRSDHSILGRAVNEAARLMCHEFAEGTILCDEATYNESHASFKFQSSNRKIHIKGSDEPMEVYVPLNPRLAPRSSVASSNGSVRRRNTVNSKANNNQSSLKPQPQKSPSDASFSSITSNASSGLSTPLLNRVTGVSSNNHGLSPILGSVSLSNFADSDRDSGALSSTSAVSIIGRARETREILECISAWSEGNIGSESHTGRKLLLVGESGQGKTALCDFFLEKVKSVPKAIVCWGRASEAEKFTPYYCYRGILKSFTEQVDTTEVPRGHTPTHTVKNRRATVGFLPIPTRKDSPKSQEPLPGRRSSFSLIESIGGSSDASANLGSRLRSSTISASNDQGCLKAFSIPIDKSVDGNLQSPLVAETDGKAIESKTAVDDKDISIPTAFADLPAAPLPEIAEGRWADYWEATMVNPALSPTGEIQESSSPIVKYPLVASPQKPNFGDTSSSPNLAEGVGAVDASTNSTNLSAGKSPSGLSPSEQARDGKSSNPLPRLSQPTKSSLLTHSWTSGSNDSSPSNSNTNIRPSLTIPTASPKSSPNLSRFKLKKTYDRFQTDDFKLPKSMMNLSASQTRIPDSEKKSTDEDCSPYNSLEDLPTNFKDTEKKLKNVVLKLRENWHVLPLFNDLLGCKFQSNKLLNSMTGENARRSLSRAVIALINKASVILKVPVCIMLDDMQWQDSLSWQLTMEIISNCPHVLVFMSSRPLQEYEMSTKPFFAATLQNPVCTKINLLSLDLHGVESFIIATFSEWGVERVEPALSYEVFQRSNGNCFVLETICASLKKSMDPDYAHSPRGDDSVGAKIRNTVGRNELIIKHGKFLTFSGSSIHEILEEFLPKDTNSAILIQYDRLSARFQRLLAIASCLGQTFTIKTLWAVCIRDESSSDLIGQASPDTLRAVIKSEDVFNFLVPAGGRRVSVDNVAIGMKNGYRFRHVLIQKGIYNTLLSEDKECLHLAMANHLSEDILNDNNAIQILPLIMYHLENVPGLETRKFEIYEKLLKAYHGSSSVVEGLATYLKLHDLLESEGVNVKKESIREIHKCAAEFHLCIQDLEEAKKLATIAISNFGKPIKINYFRMMREAFLHVKMWGKLRKLSYGSADNTRLSDLPTHPDVATLSTEEIVVWLELLDLLNVCGQFSTYWKERIILSLLCANSSPSIATKHPIKFAICLMGLADLLTSLGMEAMALRYFKIAMSIGGLVDKLHYLKPSGQRERSGSLVANDLLGMNFTESLEEGDDIAMTMRRRVSGMSLSDNQERLLTESLTVLCGLGCYTAASSISYQIRASIEAKGAEGSWMNIQAFRIECSSRLLAGPVTSYRALSGKFLFLAKTVQTLSKSFIEPLAVVHLLLSDVLCGDQGVAEISANSVRGYLGRLEECKEDLHRKCSSSDIRLCYYEVLYASSLSLLLLALNQANTDEVIRLAEKCADNFACGFQEDIGRPTPFITVIIDLVFDFWIDRLMSTRSCIDDRDLEKSTSLKLALVIMKAPRLRSFEERRIRLLCADLLQANVLFIQGDIIKAATSTSKAIRLNRDQLSHCTLLSGVLHARCAKLAMAAHFKVKKEKRKGVLVRDWFGPQMWGWTRLGEVGHEIWEAEALIHAKRATELLTTANASFLLGRLASSVPTD